MAIVGRLQTAGRLMDIPARCHHVAGAIFQNVAFQVAALDQLHHQIDQGRQRGIGRYDLTGVEGHDNVRMTQLGQHAHLGVKAFLDRGSTVLVHRQNLDGDTALHQVMLGEEHHAHAAAAERIKHMIIAQHKTMRRTGQDAIQLITRQQSRLHQRLANLGAAGIFRQSIFSFAEEAIDDINWHQSELDNGAEEPARVGVQTAGRIRFRLHGRGADFVMMENADDAIVKIAVGGFRAMARNVTACLSIQTGGRMRIHVRPRETKVSDRGSGEPSRTMRMPLGSRHVRRDVLSENLHKHRLRSSRWQNGAKNPVKPLHRRELSPYDKTLAPESKNAANKSRDETCHPPARGITFSPDL